MEKKIENIFPNDKETIEKLKGYAIKPDYNEIFFEHLRPELKKIYIDKINKLEIKNFIEAVSYEYGFLDKRIDLPKAFSLYKKYADLNDYFCMYKMHVIYLCEYEKFNVPFNRVLERIYLLKCFAYLPNYVYDSYLKLFEKIDVIYEIAQILDLELGNNSDFKPYDDFFDLLLEDYKKYNLKENDIYLMKGCLFCYFRQRDDDQDFNLLLFSILYSISPKEELDYTYYVAKNKCIYFKDFMQLQNMMSDEEIDKFYKEIKEKQLYQFYTDYGNYYLDKNVKATPEIIDIFTIAANNGYLFSCFRVYQCIIDYYDFEDIMSDYNKITKLITYLLDEIVFEKLSLGQFILFMGLSLKYSKFQENLIRNYFKYIKELNEYITLFLSKKEKEKKKNIKPEPGKDEFYLFNKAFIYWFGFQGIEKQNLPKAVELIDEGLKITEKKWVKKNNEYIKYKIKQLMFSLRMITKEELIQAEKYLIDFFSKNLNLKYEIIDCFIAGKDYFEGIINKKDEFIGLTIYKSILNHFCGNIYSCPIKSEVKEFLKNHEYKIVKTLKDETCCICYDKKINKMLIPCKHSFCSNCAERLEKDSKCPICRGQILCII